MVYRPAWQKNFPYAYAFWGGTYLYGYKGAQFLAHKPVNFASLTDSFIVSFSKLLKLWSWMKTRQTLNSFSGPKSYRDFQETGLLGISWKTWKNKFLKRRHFSSLVLNAKKQVHRLRKHKMIKLRRPDGFVYLSSSLSVTLKCTRKSSPSWQRTKCLQIAASSHSRQLLFSRYRSFYTISLIFPLIIAVAC